MSTPTAEQTIRAGANRLERESGAGFAADTLVREALRRVPPEQVIADFLAVLGEASWPIPRLMGMKAAAEALGVRDSNLHKVRELVPALKLDRGNLYRATDVERLAQQRAAEQRNGGE